MLASEAGCRGHAQGAAHHSALLLNVRRGFGQRLQCRRTTGEVAHALGGELHLTGCALEQAHVQLVFQPSHVLTDRSRGDAQRTGGSSEPAALRRLYKRLDQPQVHALQMKAERDTSPALPAPEPAPTARPVPAPPLRLAAPERSAQVNEEPAVIVLLHVPDPRHETAAAPAPKPTWTVRAKDTGRPRHQGSMFDPPRPVPAEPEPRKAEAEKTWRKAGGGKGQQMNLF